MGGKQSRGGLDAGQEKGPMQAEPKFPPQHSPTEEAMQQQPSIESQHHHAHRELVSNYALAAQHALCGMSPDSSRRNTDGTTTPKQNASSSNLHFKPSRSMADMHKVSSLANFGGDELRAAQYEKKNQKQLDEAR